MKKTIKSLIITTFVFLLLCFQFIKTQLTITIRDDVGNTVEGTTVKLYEKEEDYKKENKAVAEGKTDAKGIVKFKELKAIPYFVMAEKGDQNNFGGGEQIGKLEANKINKVTIVIQ